jgi:transcriptional regulator with XRE-family HTH domain
MEIPERYTPQRRDLGARLRALREAASLTGTEAAERSKMSQPKISRIENAVLVPSVEDVDTLLHVYGARKSERDELLELASTLHARYQRARTVVRGGAAHAQQQIGKIEAETALLRIFELAWIPPLLQTPEYMRLILSTGSRGDEMAHVIAAREDRQQALYDTDRRFHFVITESALRVRPGSRALQRVQLERVSALSKLPNVRVAVIPDDIQVTEVPLHGFTIYDERLVTVDLETSTVTFTEERDVGRYAELYDRLEKDAPSTDDAREHIARIAASLSAAA